MRGSTRWVRRVGARLKEHEVGGAVPSHPCAPVATANERWRIIMPPHTLLLAHSVMAATTAAAAAAAEPSTTTAGRSLSQVGGFRDDQGRPAAASIAVVVRPSVAVAQLSGAMNGAGMEELNHEIYGGVYSQMIHGESFEEPVGADGVSGLH